MHYSLYCVFIMRDNQIWNLAVKMTTYSLSSWYGIVALLVLKLFSKVTYNFLIPVSCF